MDEKLLTRIPISKATQPFDGALVIANRYWTVVDGCILFYRKKSPQCNSDRRLVEHTNKRLYPTATVEFLPVVFVEHNCWEDK